MALPSPDDVREILALPFIVMYWPAIIATALFFIALARGAHWYAVPVALGGLALQALHAGWFQ